MVIVYVSSKSGKIWPGVRGFWCLLDIKVSVLLVVANYTFLSDSFVMNRGCMVIEESGSAELSSNSDNCLDLYMW
jgi:hypothetical protein